MSDMNRREFVSFGLVLPFLGKVLQDKKPKPVPTYHIPEHERVLIELLQPDGVVAQRMYVSTRDFYVTDEGKSFYNINKIEFPVTTFTYTLHSIRFTCPGVGMGITWPLDYKPFVGVGIIIMFNPKQVIIKTHFQHLPKLNIKDEDFIRWIG